MLWLILSIGVVLFGLFSLFMAITDDYDAELWVIGAILLLLIGIGGCGFWVSGYMTWKTTVTQLDVYPQTIQNEIYTIEQMRLQYKKPEQNGQVNIDMVNSNLTMKINEEIASFNNSISDYNLILMQWKVAYENRFISTCWCKPKNTKVLKLSDYKF